jgi:hypothetical protein
VAGQTTSPTAGSPANPATRLWRIAARRTSSARSTRRADFYGVPSSRSSADESVPVLRGGPQVRFLPRAPNPGWSIGPGPASVANRLGPQGLGFETSAIRHAGVVQWSERQPSKLEVRGSSPPARSITSLASEEDHHGCSIQEASQRPGRGGQDARLLVSRVRRAAHASDPGGRRTAPILGMGWERRRANVLALGPLDL